MPWTACTTTVRFISMENERYSTLARYYDDLVRDDDASNAWADWVLGNMEGTDFLELACGSGEITRRLAKKLNVSALDLSEDMVKEAASKPGNENVKFTVGDMQNLEGFGMYDAIGCFCDSFNYLLSDEQAAAFFEQCAAHLKPGGLLFFDTHSTDRLEEFADDYEETGTFEDGTGLQWVISSEDEYIYQDFAFYFDDQTIQEHHMQRVFQPELLEKLLEPWFEIESITTDFDQPGICEGEKYFYLCRRKETQ